MATTLHATCEWFDFKKGFGFIKSAESSESVFVHQTAIATDGFRKLSNGQACTYELSTDDEGRPKAVNVVPGELGEPPTRRSRRNRTKKDE